MIKQSDKRSYWDGRTNYSIRLYFYIQRGLALLNEFRYLIFSVMALYALLKLNNPWYMVGMFLFSIPILLVLGWMFVHKMAKVMDFLNVQFSTHFSRYSVELQEQILESINKLNELIKKDKL